MCERLYATARVDATAAHVSGMGGGSPAHGGGHGALGRPRTDRTRAVAHATLWWALLAAHAARALLLLDPSPTTYLDGVLVCGALTQRLSLELQARLAGVGGGVSASGVAAARRPTLRTRDAILRLGLLSIATQRAHYALLPRLLRALGGAEPPHAVTLGASMALYACGGHLLSLSLPGAPRALSARLCGLLLGMAAMLSALQPVLDVPLVLESLVWTLFHPTASLTFGGTPRLLLWPPWLLLLLGTLALASGLRLLPILTLSPPSRLCACALVGATTALTASGWILPLERSLFLLTASAAALGGAFLAVALWPHALVVHERAPSVLLGLHYALFPLGLVAQSHAFAHSPIARTVGALALYRATWLVLYAGTSAVGALLARLHVAAALSRDAASRAAPPRADGPDGTHGADGASADDASASAAPNERRALSSVALRVRAYEHHAALKRAGLGWMGRVGNLCALASVGTCLGMHLLLLEGTVRAIVPLAPLLLLLHPHTPPFTSLHSANRYAPVCGAIAAVLAAAALFEVSGRARATGLSTTTLRGGALALCALPSLLLCCRFLWGLRQCPAALIWGAWPLNAVPLLLSHSRPIYDLGGAGVLAGALHLWMARQAKRASLDYI